MKKITLILVLILITATIGSGLTSIAFAAAETSFDNTYVLDDLNGSQINGEQFDIVNYGYSKERQAQVLTFAEYGFNYDSSKQNYYGLYVYVYNPSGEAIDEGSNSITVATVYEEGKAVDYDKFDLQLLSASKDEYANLFYKFKLADVSKILTRVSANTNLRRYDVGEIELNYGNANSEAFTVSNYYEYSGFAKGCGADGNAESNLTCKSNSIETLQLQVNSTYYNYNYNKLSSVYFGVPNSLLKKYGKLQQIKANWFETHTNEMLVMKQKQAYDILYPYIGVDIGYENGNIGWQVNWDYLPVDNSKPLRGYNTSANNRPVGFEPLTKMTWLFYAPSGNVSTDTVISTAAAYSKKYSQNLLLNKYSKDLFTQTVDEGRQYGWQGTDGTGTVIDADTQLSLEGLTFGSSFLDWFAGLFRELPDTVEYTPIKLVKDEDVLDTKTISTNLLIAEEDVSKFLTVYQQNKLADKTTFIFRFASTRYERETVTMETNPPKFFPQYIKDAGYVVTKQTVFLDFDIIYLKFLKENIETVIPTISSPIDVIGGLTPPPKIDDPLEWLRQLIEWIAEHWWVIVVGIIVIAIIAALIVGIVKAGAKAAFKVLGTVLWWILRILFYIVTLPIWLIVWGARAVKQDKEEKGK